MATLFRFCDGSGISSRLGVSPRGLDDLLELGEHGGAADEEAVDVGLANQLLAVSGLDRATVENSRLASVLRRDVLGEPFADLSVRLLSLLLRRDLASSDSPYGLVGNNQVGHARRIHSIQSSEQLRFDDVQCLACFPLL